MQTVFSLSEYSDLEVRFFTKEHGDEGRWVSIWSIHPENVSLVEMNGFIVCEIKSTSQTGPDVFFDFKRHLLKNNLLQNNVFLNVTTSSENQQNFYMFNLEPVVDGVAACILGKEPITLNNTPAQKTYSAEEEAFFSLFKTEVHGQ